MSEIGRFESREMPKSFIRINGKEHNVVALLDLLKENKIKIKSLSSRDPRPDVLERVKNDFIPSVWTQIEVEASYEDVYRVLESSDEFREHANKILGSV